MNSLRLFFYFLCLVLLSACSVSPGDFPEEDVYCMENGVFFVYNGNGAYTSYDADGDKMSDKWWQKDVQDKWILIGMGDSVTVALPRDKNPEDFLVSTTRHPEWTDYGRKIIRVSDEEPVPGLTAADFGLTPGVLPDSAKFYMKADNGDELSVFISQTGNYYTCMANNLEGWVFSCVDPSQIIDSGDNWTIGGPTFVSVDFTQDRPYLFIAKDWSWVQVSNVDGFFNQYVTEQEFKQKSEKLCAEIRARGENPRNPMAVILDQANAHIDTRSKALTAEIKAAVDAPSTSGYSSSRSVPSGNSRSYVRVKEYSPNYTGSDEVVYCAECGRYDYPHIHYNKTY